VLSMNSLDVAADIVNNLDNETLVKAMYHPERHSGTVEDVLTRAINHERVELKYPP